MLKYTKKILVIAKDFFFKWNANLVLVSKLSQIKPRLIYNYYFIYKLTIILHFIYLELNKFSLLI